MRKKLKIHLSVADLFSAPTIESLAYKVSSMKTLGSPAMTQNQSSTTKKRRNNFGTGLYNCLYFIRFYLFDTITKLIHSNNLLRITFSKLICFSFKSSFLSMIYIKNYFNNKKGLTHTYIR